MMPPISQVEVAPAVSAAGNSAAKACPQHVEKHYIEVTINRLREEWAACEFEFGGKRVSLTASFGIAGFCGKDSPTFQALVARADKALYAAKRTGGNRVEVSVATEAPALQSQR